MMETFNRKQHWETIYHTKALNEVSWYQARPEPSLSLISSCNLPLDASIIDIGGGDSLLVDHLLDLGYSRITVLDISAAAIERAKARLGKLAAQVTWMVSDVVSFQVDNTYDLWHDRAAFHFLTNPMDVETYVANASQALHTGGHVIIGTFSVDGPKKCSGIDVQQYSTDSLAERFAEAFSILERLEVEHTTPFSTVQRFVFVRGQKK